MEYIIRALTYILIPIVIHALLGYLRQPRQAEDGKVFLPKALGILGIIFSVIFLIPTLITALLSEPLWIPLVFSAFSLLGVALIVAFVNCRISYDDTGFVSKSFFGKQHAFTYDQITAIKENEHESYIYIGKHKVMVDEFSIGGIEFIQFVKVKYKTIHNGQHLPTK